jgi:hypothetical protein
VEVRWAEVDLGGQGWQNGGIGVDHVDGSTEYHRWWYLGSR